MADGTLTTSLVEHLFGSGWPVALMLLAFILVGRKALVPGWALSDRDKQLVEKNAEIAMWIQRYDDRSKEVQRTVESLERATDALQVAISMAKKATP